MKLYYHTLKGHTERFVDKLGIPGIRISTDTIATEAFVIITTSIGKGQVPDIVSDFVERSKEHIKGVGASGVSKYGDNYGAAATILSQQYNVPVLHRWELDGTDADVEAFVSAYNNL